MTITAELLKRDANPLAYKDLDIPGWPDIDPATVVMALNDAAKYAGLELSQEVIDKVHAVQTMLVNPVAYASSYMFEKTAEALNGLVPQFGYYPVELPASQIAFAVAVMCKIRPNEEWGVSVKRYCREMLRAQGVESIPPSMECVKFDDPENRSDKFALNEEQQRIQDERLADIADYVKQHLGE